MAKISKPKKEKTLQTDKPVRSKAPAKAQATATDAPVPAASAAVTVLAAGVTPEERHRMVAEAAYYIALKKGVNSDPSENWFEAEKQVDETLKAKAKR